MKLVTHNGKFHTDEVFGAAMLSYLYPNIEIIRTRDMRIISKAFDDNNTIVIDVGLIYNPQKDAYDHHQASFNTSYYGGRRGINMSSCGLVWKHFSWEIVDKMLRDCFSTKLIITKEDIEDDSDLSEDEEGTEYIKDYPNVDTDKICNCFYNEVVIHIDANDNGVKHIKNPESVQYNYKKTVTIENIIGSYNGNDGDNEKQMIQFKQAMKVCEEFLFNRLYSIIKNEIEYGKYLKEFEAAFIERMNDEWIYIENEKMNYSLYLNNYDPQKNIKFIIVKKKGEYRIHTRRIKGGEFAVVAPIINEIEARNIVRDKLIFVHRAQFVGACKTLETSISICDASIKSYWGWMFPLKEMLKKWGW